VKQIMHQRKVAELKKTAVNGTKKYSTIHRTVVCVFLVAFWVCRESIMYTTLSALRFV
jgi:hypothetical protein